MRGTALYIKQELKEDEVNKKESSDSKIVYVTKIQLDRNRNKFINQIRAPGGHIQLTNMIDTQQQYIKLNIHGEVPIIVVQAHSGRNKRDTIFSVTLFKKTRNRNIERLQ
jgi:hypothetical protein